MVRKMLYSNKMGSSELEIKGKNVILRSLKEEDLKYLEADLEFRRMVGGDQDERPLSLEERKKLFRKKKRDKSRRNFTILAKDGKAIGHVFLHHINDKDRRAGLAIGIHKKTFRGRGLGTEATKLILRYGFEVLGLHRIDLRVLEYNEAAIKCYEKCGFKEEGRERESGFVDGKWYDDIRMSILEHEWKKVEERKT